MSESVSGRPSRVAMDTDDGGPRGERCAVPVKRARMERDDQDGRRRAGPHRSCRQLKDHRLHASSKGKHKHTTKALHSKESNASTRHESSKPQTLPVTSLPSSSVCPATPTSVSQSIPVVINLCTPSPDANPGTVSVSRVPETPVREQRDIPLQRTIPTPTRSNERHSPSLPSEHSETQAYASSSSTCSETAGAHHAHQPKHCEPTLHSDAATASDETAPPHGHTRRTRRGRRRNNPSSTHGQQQLLPQFRSAEPSRRHMYLTRSIATSVGAPNSRGTISLSELEGAVPLSAGGVSGLSVSREERRSAFTPVFPIRSCPPPTSGPNGLGFVLASSFMPTPFSHTGATSSSSASQSSFVSPFTSSSSPPPTSYGTLEYWSSMASQADRGASFIASHSAGRRPTDPFSIPTSSSPIHGDFSSFPPPLNPIRAHQSQRATLYNRPRPPYYSHPHIATTSSHDVSPTQHIVSHSTAFPPVQLSQSPPPSMSSLMSEVSPTVMPVSPTMIPFPRYVPLTNQPIGTLARHSGLLTSTTSTDADSSTSPVSVFATSAANTQSARGLPFGEIATSEHSSRLREEQLRTNGTSASSAGSQDSDYSRSGVERLGRAEVDVIVVVDSSDEDDDDVIIHGVDPPRPGVRVDNVTWRRNQIARDEEYARQLQSQFNEENSAMSRHFPSTTHLWSSTGPSGVVPAGHSIPMPRGQPSLRSVPFRTSGHEEGGSRLIEDNFDALASRVHAWTATDARRFLHVAAHHGSRRRRRPRTERDFLDAVMDLSPSVLYRAIMTSPARGGIGSNYEELLELAERLGPARPQGLTKEVINSLPVKEFSDQSNDNTNCVVCMCEFKVKEKLRTLPCLHDFHQKCIDPWLKEHCTCPICRVDVQSK